VCIQIILLKAKTKETENRVCRKNLMR